VKTARRIRRYIEAELLDGPFDGGDPLAAGVLDSLAIEELIAHLEQAYAIRFEEDDLVRKNFASVHALAALIDAKRARA